MFDLHLANLIFCLISIQNVLIHKLCTNVDFFNISDLYNCFILNENNITAGCKNIRIQNKIGKCFHCIKIEIEMKQNKSYYCLFKMFY